jgi:hypothetical protein
MSREIYISSNIKHRGVIMSKKLFALLLLAMVGSSVYAMEADGESASEDSAQSVGEDGSSSTPASTEGNTGSKASGTFKATSLFQRVRTATTNAGSAVFVPSSDKTFLRWGHYSALISAGIIVAAGFFKVSTRMVRKIRTRRKANKEPAA